MTFLEGVGISKRDDPPTGSNAGGEGGIQFKAWASAFARPVLLACPLPSTVCAFVLEIQSAIFVQNIGKTSEYKDLERAGGVSNKLRRF